MNWRKGEDKLLKLLPLMGDQFKNVTLNFKDGKKIRTNKFLLGIMSSFFDEMFFGDKTNPQETLYDIEDADFDTFSVLLAAVCSDNKLTKKQSSGQLLHVLRLAVRFDLQGVQESTANRIKDQFTKSNDWMFGLELFNDVQRLGIRGMEPAIQHLGHLLLSNMKQVMDTDGWKSLPKDFVVGLFRKGSLKVSEGCLIRGAVSWCSAMPGQQALATFKADFLPLFRPGAITKSDYEENLAALEFLPREVKLGLMPRSQPMFNQAKIMKELSQVHVFFIDVSAQEVREAAKRGRFVRKVKMLEHEMHLEMTRKLCGNKVDETGDSVTCIVFGCTVSLKSCRPDTGHLAVGWYVLGSGQRPSYWTWRPGGINSYTISLEFEDCSDVCPHIPVYTFYAIADDAEELEAEMWSDKQLVKHNTGVEDLRPKFSRVKRGDKIKFQTDKSWNICPIYCSKSMTHSSEHKLNEVDPFEARIHLMLMSLKFAELRYYSRQQFFTTGREQMMAHLALYRPIFVGWRQKSEAPTDLLPVYLAVAFHEGGGVVKDVARFWLKNLQGFVMCGASLAVINRNMKVTDLNCYYVRVGGEIVEFGSIKIVGGKVKLDKFPDSDKEFVVGSFDVLVVEPKSLESHLTYRKVMEAKKREFANCS